MKKIITVECNRLTCRHQWELEVEEERIVGNRIIGLVPCPECYRMDSPYVVPHKQDLEKQLEINREGLKSAQQAAARIQAAPMGPRAGNLFRFQQQIIGYRKQIAVLEKQISEVRS